MKIGLWSDAQNFPSIPLMKLSAYRKSCGDSVKLVDDCNEHFDIVYCSKTFNLPNVSKIPKIPSFPNADSVITGGSGLAIDILDGKEYYQAKFDTPLSHKIEHLTPDYGLYSVLTKDTAFGFLTRGCPNRCPFCIASKKEGIKSVQTAELSEFWSGQRDIKLMDANLLACSDRERLIMQLISSKARICYTQGLDARYIDADISKLICHTNISMVHFAFDLMKNGYEIIKGLRTFRQIYKGSDRSCKVYILTNYNTTHYEDWYRVRKVIELGYRPDIRIYQKGTHSQFLTDLAGWANNSRIYRVCSFAEYIPRVDGKRCGELYSDILKGGAM